MKTISAYFFSLLIVLLFSSLFLTSCKAKQPLQETKETTTVNHDSIFQSRVITRNKAITDSLKIVIGKVRTEKKECDSVCQTAIDRILSQFNNKKSSGDNSVETFYNPKDKSLNINTKVGETKNDSLKFYWYITKTKTVYSHRDIPVDKPIPKWQLFLMISGAVAIGFYLFKLILFIRSRIPA